jgi:hypothetical protein
MRKYFLGLAAVAAIGLASPASAGNSYSTFSFSGGNAVSLVLNGGASTLTATNTGWYTDAGMHSSDNPNYIAGVCGSSDFCAGDDVIRNDYFVFDLSHFTDTILSATMSMLQNPLPSGGYISSAPFITFTNYDVSTAFSSLVADQTSAASTYTDLGSGVIYAQTNILSTSDGTTVNINFNVDGLAALNASRGGNFATGGSVLQAAQQAGVPEPASWALMIGGFGLAGASLRRRRAIATA